MTPSSENADYPGNDANSGLSNRQIEILSLISQSEATSRICESVSVSEATLKRDLAGAFEVLDACNRASAIFEAKRIGLIKRSDPPGRQDGRQGSAAPRTTCREASGIAGARKSTP